MCLDRLPEARQVAEKLRRSGFGRARIHQRFLELAYVVGDKAAIDREIEWFAGKREEYLSLGLQAADRNVHGRRRESHNLYQRAAEQVRRLGLRDVGPEFEEVDALADALAGNCQTARLLKRPALALAICGDAAQAEKLAAETSKLFPNGIIWNAVQLPGIRAAIALSPNQAAKSVELLASAALITLCENYWYPLYAYLRRRGYPADQAQDLTQEFFVRVLEGRYLNRANPEKGRFRSFLLTSLKFFVADEQDRLRASKRGGGAAAALEFSSGEERYQRDPGHTETPERIFERRWALSVLDRVLENLSNEFVHHGRPEYFERLKVFLLGHSEAPYAALAREMNTSEGALKVAIHRLRKRDRELFRQAIADTAADPAEVESELRYLAAVLSKE